jgi:cytochrome c oxidase subunit 2
MWFVPEREGEYELFCSQYCGLQHSYMVSSVVVMSAADFKKWYTDTTKTIASVDARPGAAGLSVMKKNGCFACHSLDGSKLVGPSYKGMYGHKITVLVNGDEKEIEADDEYIKRAIYDPNIEIVKGYSKNMMQPYKGVVSDAEIAEIIEYLKTLK